MHFVVRTKNIFLPYAFSYTFSYTSRNDTCMFTMMTTFNYALMHSMKKYLHRKVVTSKTTTATKHQIFSDIRILTNEPAYTSSSDSILGCKIKARPIIDKKV